MTSTPRRAFRAVAHQVNDAVVRWRSGSREGQLTVLAVLVAIASTLFAVSIAEYEVMPVSGFYLPMLLGMLLLRFWPLLVLVGITAAMAVTTVVNTGDLTTTRAMALTMMGLSIALILYEASRHRSGLPGPLGEAMLVDLRDKLQSQGTVPPLPPGWRSQSITKTAGGINFAGDFLVANLAQDEKTLEMVLVDVCGKGVGAGSQSLQFAGALGGLIGSLPPLGLVAAANDFLLRQRWDDGFATAVHVIVDLGTGEYSIISAGHPPALRWDAVGGEWSVDGARGMALGIAPRPEFHSTRGILDHGDALMFYTDGVVETRTRGLDEGIARLREVARTAVASGFEHAPRRILAKLGSAQDDRAILILSREP